MNAQSLISFPLIYQVLIWKTFLNNILKNGILDTHPWKSWKGGAQISGKWSCHLEPLPIHTYSPSSFPICCLSWWYQIHRLYLLHYDCQGVEIDFNLRKPYPSIHPSIHLSLHLLIYSINIKHLLHARSCVRGRVSNRNTAAKHSQTYSLRLTV